MPKRKQSRKTPPRPRVVSPTAGRAVGPAARPRPPGWQQAWRRPELRPYVYLAAAVVLVAVLAVAAWIYTQRTTTPSTSAAAIAATPTASAAAPATPAATSSAGATTVPPKTYSAPPAMAIDPNQSYIATIETDKGTIKVELLAKDAPKTVNNFVFLAREKFYENVKFHRIIKNFMVQTGDPTGTGAGGPGYRFEDEPVTRNYGRGTVAMANAGPNTNGSQFFIVHQDASLPKNYTIFGQVTDNTSLEVLDKIANVPVRASRTGEQSEPTEVVTIKSVDIAER